MKKTMSISLLLLLLSFIMIAAQSSGLPTVENYPSYNVDSPPAYAVRGDINGNINNESMVAAMTSLAKEYNLAGWIKKLPDGTMRFHLQGPQKSVKEAVEKIPKCDPGSKVSSVDTKAAAITIYMSGFKRIEND